MTTAGIIGGLAAPSTKLFYEAHTQLANEHNDYHPLLIHSLNINEFKAVKNSYHDSLNYVSNAIRAIEEHTEFTAIICNTAHYAIDTLRRRHTQPILGIHEETMANITEETVGILGTKTTIQSGIYQRELLKQGKHPVTPPSSMQHDIDQATFNDMVHNQRLDAFKDLLQDALAYLDGHGCDAVILACTEYPLHVSPHDTDLSVYSSTHCLARAVIRKQREPCAAS